MSQFVGKWQKPSSLIASFCNVGNENRDKISASERQRLNWLPKKDRRRRVNWKCQLKWKLLLPGFLDSKKPPAASNFQGLQRSNARQTLLTVSQCLTKSWSIFIIRLTSAKVSRIAAASSSSCAGQIKQSFLQKLHYSVSWLIWVNGIHFY